MVVKHTVRSAHNCLAVFERVPCYADAWRKVIEVAWNALRNPQCVLRSLRQRIDRTEGRRELHIVPHAIVEGQISHDAPTVLPKSSEGRIRKRIVWVTHTLNEVCGEASTIGLNRTKAGKRYRRRRKTEGRSCLCAKVVNAAKVYGEVGSQRQIVAINAKLHVV